MYCSQWRLDQHHLLRRRLAPCEIDPSVLSLVPPVRHANIGARPSGVGAFVQDEPLDDLPAEFITRSLRVGSGILAEDESCFLDGHLQWPCRRAGQAHGLPVKLADEVHALGSRKCQRPAARRADERRVVVVSVEAHGRMVDLVNFPLANSCQQTHRDGECRRGARVAQSVRRPRGGQKRLSAA